MSRFVRSPQLLQVNCTSNLLRGSFKSTLDSVEESLAKDSEGSASGISSESPPEEQQTLSCVVRKPWFDKGANLYEIRNLGLGLQMKLVLKKLLGHETGGELLIVEEEENERKAVERAADILLQFPVSSLLSDFVY